MSKLANKLSIIVPVYQAKDYLERCVVSLVNQTYQNIEIILVDDGSTDGSASLCDVLCKTYERVKVIHKINGGLSSARNAGISKATGEFLTFVDSDDWVTTYIYDKCMDVMNSCSVDVVDFNVAFASNETDVVTFEESDVAVKTFEGEDILYDYLYSGQVEKCPFSVCRKVYKKQLFERIRFPEGRINEDIVTNFKLLEKAKKLVKLSDVGYYYFQGNTNSITSGVLKKKDFDLIKASQELCDLSIGCNDPRIRELAQIKLGRSYFSLLARAAKYGVSSDVSSYDLSFLKLQLRRVYVRLLKSPMPLNRKMLATLCCIDYRILTRLLRLIKC